jgi:CBS domain-containing protein
MREARALIDATIEKLNRHPPFCDMARDDLEWMIARMALGYFAAGEVVLGPGCVPQTFFIIKQGVVLAERADQASSQAAWMELREAECFPFAALISGRQVVSTYRATTDVFCYTLPRAEFLALMAKSKPFADFCTQRLAHLFGQAKRILQSQYAHKSLAQHSLLSPLSAVMRPNPLTCAPHTPLAEVVAIMARHGIGSMVAVDAAHRPVGIFTLRDILPRVVLPGRDLQCRFDEVMTPNPVSMPPHAFAHDAALLMARHGFRHVLVVEHDKLVGLVSERDLFSLQRLGPRQVGDTIRHAESLDTLKTCAADIRELAHTLLAQGVGAEQLSQIISTLNDVLTERILQLSLQASPLAGLEFCWLALGSEGRLEQTLNTDQDNGILFTVPPGQSAEGVRRALLSWARHINEALDACGFPLCKGEVMASNPKWCLSLQEWQQTFSQWLDQGDPKALLNAAIFFDFRGLFGHLPLALTLRDWLAEKAARNPRFLHQMAANALRNKPPLGVVREFITADDNTLDLKMCGVTPFVDGARILGLARGSKQTSTVGRFRDLMQQGHLEAREGEAYIDAFLFIQLMRLRLHHEQAASGAPLTNQLAPDSLNPLERRILRESFRQARKLQHKLALDYP